MVERPTSIHLHPKTTLKFRILSISVSLILMAAGFYIAWRAFKILEPTPFSRAAAVLLSAVIIGIVIWFFFIAVKSRSFRREIKDIEKFRVEHGIGKKHFKHLKRP